MLSREKDTFYDLSFYTPQGNLFRMHKILVKKRCPKFYGLAIIQEKRSTIAAKIESAKEIPVPASYRAWHFCLLIMYGQEILPYIVDYDCRPVDIIQMEQLSRFLRHNHLADYLLTLFNTEIHRKFEDSVQALDLLLRNPNNVYIRCETIDNVKMAISRLSKSHNLKLELKKYKLEGLYDEIINFNSRGEDLEPISYPDINTFLKPDLSQIFMDEDTDFTIIVGKAPGSPSIGVHAAALYARWPYFRRIKEIGGMEIENMTLIIPTPEEDSDIGLPYSAVKTLTSFFSVIPEKKEEITTLFNEIDAAHLLSKANFYLDQDVPHKDTSYDSITLHINQQLIKRLEERVKSSNDPRVKKILSCKFE